MDFVLDTHTHTIASGHAYHTIEDMIQAARKCGLCAIGITEHAPKMPGTCNEFYFHNFRVLDRKVQDLEVFYGAELNIIDYDGHVDLTTHLLKKMDITIASLHTPCIRRGSIEQNTRAIIKAIQNPYVDIIGHPDDARYPLDYEAVVKEAGKYHKLLEVNNTSISPRGVRQGCREQYMKMLAYCKQYGVSVVAGTDAHAPSHVGKFAEVEQLLKEAAFPEELVVNRSVDELKKHLHKFRK